MRASLGWFDLVGVSATVERQGMRAPGLAQVCTRLLWFAWLALLPLALVVFVVQSIRDGHGAWAIDFNGNFREPAHEILRGSSPYDPDELVRVKAARGRRPQPHRLRPRRVRGLSGARAAPRRAVHGAALRRRGLAVVRAAFWPRADSRCVLAGVRDRRVYAAALLAPPVIGSLYYGAIDLVLMLGLAACWRWRDHAGRAGLALGRDRRAQARGAAARASGSSPRAAGARRRRSLAVAGGAGTRSAGPRSASTASPAIRTCSRC